MHPTNPVVFDKPAVVQQLDIFGGYDEIAVSTSAVIRRTAPAAAKFHDGPPLREKAASPEPLRNPVRKPVKDAPPALATPAAVAVTQVEEELLLDPDEPVSIDLEAIEASDTPELILAKRMFLRMMWDIDGKDDEVEPDLFGQTSITRRKVDRAQQQRFDALIWLFALNPDGAFVTVEWVFDALDFDLHLVRRIVARNMHKELKRLVHLLSSIVGPEHTQVCEDRISDYIDTPVQPGRRHSFHDLLAYQ